jgi:hypothetical protein
MPDLGWKDAILRVLNAAAEPMHYTAIAEAIAVQSLRSELGATPATTVNSTISQSIQTDGLDSPFVRVSRGIYDLKRSDKTAASRRMVPAAEEPDDTGPIKAFGMYWNRKEVRWESPMPQILGQQQAGATHVDFSGQQGVYLLHDGRAVVYVGRATEQPLGIRLKQHTLDRLDGRWDRFSWFGVLSVGASGALGVNAGTKYGLRMLVVTMEALLIEGLEPPQNRKRGDDFKAAEFLQVKDPEIERTQALQWIQRQGPGRS